MVNISISKRYSHIVKENGKYWFILPDQTDREVPVDWIDNVDWATVYMDLYRYKLEHNIDMFDDVPIENLLKEIGKIYSYGNANSSYVIYS